MHIGLYSYFWAISYRSNSKTISTISVKYLQQWVSKMMLELPSLQQMRVYLLLLVHPSLQMWLGLKSQKDFAVSQLQSHCLLSSGAGGFIFSANNRAKGLWGTCWFSWESPVSVLKWGCLTPTMELCCPVSSLQCCQTICSGSGGGPAFLFLWYLSSDILTPDLRKKTW